MTHTPVRQRIYYDCEFIDTGREILPISVGLKADDGGQLYRISNSQPIISRALSDPWLAENVVTHLPVERFRNTWAWKVSHPDMYSVRGVSQIAQDVKHFVTSRDPGVQLWSWCGAHDHVMLTQLFGRMIDAPQGLPHHTKDLQQEIDRLGLTEREDLLPQHDPAEGHNALADACWHKRIGDFLIAYEQGDPGA